ncbi:MAG: hypothetical protein HPY65_13850 [Syntrophaceae bacterium]|nr:hypothetical protein [Syntrophaceae bacterium]
MPNATLGSLTFASNPDTMTLIKKDRDVAWVKTYSSVAIFSWGSSYAGKKLDLAWSYMDTGEFADLEDIQEADAQVVFDPQDGSGRTFNVEILALDGEYHLYLKDDTGQYRKNVKLTLLIMSEAAS